MKPKKLEVPPHARKRYRQWIDPDATDDQICAALREALRGGTRLFAQPDHRAHYAVHGGAYRLVVRHAPGHAPAVVTVLPGVGDPRVPDEEPYEPITEAPPSEALPEPRATEVAVVAPSEATRADTARARDVRRHTAELRGNAENLAKVRAWRLLLQLYPQIDSLETRGAIRSAVPPAWMEAAGYGVRVPVFAVAIVSRFLRDGTLVEKVRDELRVYHERHEAWLADAGLYVRNDTLAEDLLPMLDRAIAAAATQRKDPHLSAAARRASDHLAPALCALRDAAEAWPDAIVRVTR